MYVSYSYGLPVNFQAMMLQPNKKSTKRLREVLSQLYMHLDNTASLQSGHDVSSMEQFPFKDMLNFVIFFLSERRHSRFGIRPVRVLPLRLLQN